MLLYGCISPFDATDDRKITASNFLTTISPLSAGVQALTVTAAATPTVPTASINNNAGSTRMQFDPSDAGSLTDTFDAVSFFSTQTVRDFGMGIWQATDNGAAAYMYLYAGVAGQDYLRTQCQGGGGVNTNFLTVPHSGAIFTSNTNGGGLNILTDTAAPITFSTGGHAFTNEKGRFDASGLTLGRASTVTGQLNLAASGSANLQSFQAATSPASALTFRWPAADPTAGQVLTGAAPVAGVVTMTWGAGGGGGSGTVNTGVANQLAYYPASAAAVSGNASLTVGSGFGLNIIAPDNFDTTGLDIFSNNLTQNLAIGWHGLSFTSGSGFIATPNVTLTLSDPVTFVGSGGTVLSLDMHEGGGGSIGVNHTIGSGTDGQLFIVSGAATRPGLVVQAAAAQSANIQSWQDSTPTILTAILNNGAFRPVHLADGSAANDTIYFSTTASKLVYKDSGGVVNNLY
jgi:hypothetical protein